MQQFESEGWTSGVNGTYRNLDRDDYRISLQIDDEAPDVALMISSSPCVDETDPD